MVSILEKFETSLSRPTNVQLEVSNILGIYTHSCLSRNSCSL